MSTANGHGTEGHAVVGGARPVVLLRYRGGVVRQTARTVHLVPLPLGNETGVALCGALLCPDQMEMVTPGQGVPCSPCLIGQVRTEVPPAPATNPLADAGIGQRAPQVADYQRWGWPVTQHRNEIWLTLEPDNVALIIPVPLAAHVTAILHQRRCPPPVLAHPDAPEHQIMLAGQPYDVGLHWPSGVHRPSGILPLPPTPTPRGPITWVHPPQPDALQLCREIDVFSALRTALRDPPT